MKRTFLYLLLAFAAVAAPAQSSGTGKTSADTSSSGNSTTTKHSSSKTTPAPIGYQRPDSDTRKKRYINGLFGPFTVARQVAGAGISTWRNSPEEWGDRREGFGRRVASNFAKNTIKQTTIYGLDEALNLDSHFYKSKKRDFGSKFANALISPVTARTESGKRVIGIPRIGGTYASSIIAAEAWYPSRYNWKDGVKIGTISLGFNAAFNLVKEFVKK